MAGVGASLRSWIVRRDAERSRRAATGCKAVSLNPCKSACNGFGSDSSLAGCVLSACAVEPLARAPVDMVDGEMKAPSAGSS